MTSSVSSGSDARRRALIEWYDRHKRELPWRESRDPYAVWVSEVMLQQTRVETVVPYYLRFMERFPDPASLASASDDEVMSHWSGLGYYRRARLLLAGVREVVERYGGAVPESAEARLALPGVGRYTAGAIGSIAFDREEPIVDGNVARVLARLHGIEDPIGSKNAEKQFWLHAGEIVRGERPGDLNQALMELGATVCTPRNPNCAGCPVREGCAAREGERQHVLPVPRARKAPRDVALSAVVATRGERAWLIRGDGSLFGGLFGVPMHEGHGRASACTALEQAGIEARLGTKKSGTIEHVLSHRRLAVAVWKASDAQGSESEQRKLLSSNELERVGVSSLTRRILETAGL